MPHGGRRRGRPGKAYSNRTDLNKRGPLPVQTAPSAGYGQRVAQERSQQAVPLAPPPPPAAPGAGAPVAPGPLVLPPPLDAPTARPDEPLTAGSPTGPGPGPEALNLPPPDEAEADELRAIYRMFPTEGLRELIEAYDEDDL